MRKKDRLKKAGEPLGPGEGFQGVVRIGDGHMTPFPRIDAYMTIHQLERGITGTMDQQREKRAA